MITEIKFLLRKKMHFLSMCELSFDTLSVISSPLMYLTFSEDYRWFRQYHYPLSANHNRYSNTYRKYSAQYEKQNMIWIYENNSIPIIFFMAALTRFSYWANGKTNSGRSLNAWKWQHSQVVLHNCYNIFSGRLFHLKNFLSLTVFQG